MRETYIYIYMFESRNELHIASASLATLSISKISGPSSSFKFSLPCRVSGHTTRALKGLNRYVVEIASSCTLPPVSIQAPPNHITRSPRRNTNFVHTEVHCFQCCDFCSRPHACIHEYCASSYHAVAHGPCKRSSVDNGTQIGG